MGQALADAINFKEPPMTVEQSAQGVLQQVSYSTPLTFPIQVPLLQRTSFFFFDLMHNCGTEMVLILSQLAPRLIISVLKTPESLLRTKERKCPGESHEAVAVGHLTSRHDYCCSHQQGQGHGPSCFRCICFVAVELLLLSLRHDCLDRLELPF
jgi:hypothetical protein